MSENDFEIKRDNNRIIVQFEDKSFISDPDAVRNYILFQILKEIREIKFRQLILWIPNYDIIEAKDGYANWGELDENGNFKTTNNSWCS